MADEVAFDSGDDFGDVLQDQPDEEEEIIFDEDEEETQLQHPAEHGQGESEDLNDRPSAQFANGYAGEPSPEDELQLSFSFNEEEALPVGEVESTAEGRKPNESSAAAPDAQNVVARSVPSAAKHDAAARGNELKIRTVQQGYEKAEARSNRPNRHEDSMPGAARQGTAPSGQQQHGMARSNGRGRVTNGSTHRTAGQKRDFGAMSGGPPAMNSRPAPPHGRPPFRMDSQQPHVKVLWPQGPVPPTGMPPPGNRPPPLNPPPGLHPPIAMQPFLQGIPAARPPPPQPPLRPALPILPSSLPSPFIFPAPRSNGGPNQNIHAVGRDADAHSSQAFGVAAPPKQALPTFGSSHTGSAGMPNGNLALPSFPHNAMLNNARGGALIPQDMQPPHGVGVEAPYAAPSQPPPYHQHFPHSTGNPLFTPQAKLLGGNNEAARLHHTAKGVARETEQERLAKEEKLRYMRELKALTDEQNRYNAEIRQQQQKEVQAQTAIDKANEAEELRRRIAEQQQMVENLQKLRAHKAKKASVKTEPAVADSAPKPRLASKAHLITNPSRQPAVAQQHIESGDDDVLWESRAVDNKRVSRSRSPNQMHGSGWHKGCEDRPQGSRRADYHHPEFEDEIHARLVRHSSPTERRQRKDRSSHKDGKGSRRHRTSSDRRRRND